LRNWNNRRKSETQGETGTPWRNWNARGN